MCRLSDVEVLKFLAKSIFGNTVKGEEVVSISSILVGSNEFIFFGEEKWIQASNEYSPIIMTKSGEENTLSELRMEVAELYFRNEEFSALIDEAYQ